MAKVGFGEQTAWQYRKRKNILLGDKTNDNCSKFFSIKQIFSAFDFVFHHNLLPLYPDLITHKMKQLLLLFVTITLPLFSAVQIGARFPSERKVINDPKTGTELIFLTSKSGTGYSKIYQTHNQWTSDGEWVVFRSDRVPGEAMAVNETTGGI